MSKLKMAKFYVEEHKGFDAGTIINVSPTGVRKGRDCVRSW